MPRRKAQSPAAAAVSEPAEGWWGRYQLDEDATARFAIGPLDLALHHAEAEWLIAQASNLDPFSERLIIEVPGDAPESLFGAQRHRYSFSRNHPEFALLPRTADRPVVVRPESPISVPPAESVTFYVTTPLWVSVTLGAGNAQIEDIPTLPMNDTWFGTTLAGELCYAGLTWAKNRLSSVPPRPHRLVTPVQIHNRAHDMLHVESLKLPLINLPVMVDDQQRLHTPALRLTRENADDRAVLRVVQDSSHENSRQVSPARQYLSHQSAFHVFTRLFHG